MNDLNFKAITTLVTILSLLLGGFKFLSIQEVDAKKPYLEKKLEWCEEAVRLASNFAAKSELEVELTLNERLDFYSLSDGVMAMVENADIESAMIAFEEKIRDNEITKNSTLDLVAACRKELSDDWLGW